MTSEKSEATVKATVAGHEMWKGKPLTKLDIPAWSSQYPIPLYGILPEHQAQLPIGQTLKVVLTQDNQKNDTDGSQPWHFFWSFARLATPADPPSAAPASSHPTTSGAAPQTAPTVSYEANNAQKDQAIRRAVALKAAVDHAASHEGASREMVLDIANVFAEWLEVPPTLAQAEPVAPVAEVRNVAVVEERPPDSVYEEPPADSGDAFDALPSAMDTYRARAREMLAKLDEAGPDYLVKQELFDTMMRNLSMSPAAVKGVLGGLAPFAWLKENGTKTYRDVMIEVCGAVIAGA